MEEEISLRELIEVLIKWKWIIALITIVALLISVVFSFFVLAPTYESRSTLLVNQVSKTITLEGADPIQALVQSLSGNVAMTMETYRQQVKNPYLLQQVIDELRLDPEKYNAEGMAKSVTVEVPQDSNLIRIVVSGGNPEMAAKIANALADDFVEFVNQQSRKKMTNSSQVLAGQVKLQEDELNRVMEEYRDFLAKSPGVQELQSDRDAKVQLLTDYKTRLVGLEVDLKNDQRSLEEARSQLTKTPEKLVTSKSLSDDPYLQNLAGEKSGMKTEELSKIRMSSEEMNPLYLSLQQRVSDFQLNITSMNAERESLEQAIAATTAELEHIQVDLAEKKAREDKILTRMEDIKVNYNLLSSKYEEARIASTADTGQALISKITPAMAPLNPVGPRKMLNLAIGAVLGLMLGVFIAYFWEYWTASSAGSEKETTLNV